MNTRRSEPELSCRPLEAGLYIVATPIGNLGDITLRAIETLRGCDAVACEDTRVTGRLLKHLGISKPLLRYDDHCDDDRREALVARMQGEAIALVCDAGTPLISDPGFDLVRRAREAGVRVTSLPGACAAICALSLSGLPSDRFLFAGFLPAKDKARRERLRELGEIDASVIVYESPARLTRTLVAIDSLWPDRKIAVARELTKLHEELRSASARELAGHFEDHPPRGEIVIILPPAQRRAAPDNPDELLAGALRELKPSQAAAQVAAITGLDRKALYRRALELRRS